MRDHYATQKIWRYWPSLNDLGEGIRYLLAIPENLLSSGFFYFGQVGRNNPHASFCFCMSKTRNKTVGVLRPKNYAGKYPCVLFCFLMSKTRNKVTSRSAAEAETTPPAGSLSASALIREANQQGVNSLQQTGGPICTSHSLGQP